MRSPDLPWGLTQFTPEQLESLFEPCKICGEIERPVGSGVYRIQHDYTKHFPEHGKQPVALPGTDSVT